MRKAAFLAAALAALLAGPAIAQAPPDGTPMPVRGTIEKLDGQNLTVKLGQRFGRDHLKFTVRLQEHHQQATIRWQKSARIVVTTLG